MRKTSHKWNGPSGACNTIPALEHNADVGGRAMSRYGQYTPLGLILNLEHSVNAAGAA
jgi:hypothetical protein